MIVDLKEKSGLEIKLESTGLAYDQNVFPTEPKARIFDDAKEVYLGKEDPEAELYFMYRYFEALEDAELFQKMDLEYDITVLRAGTVGEEHIKTVGHYHAYLPGSNLTYPEVYEVLEGRVEYLLQTRPDSEGNVEAVIVEAEAGDKVVVPPGYGHISINATPETVVESNLQKRDLPAGADYGSYEAYNGGALYRKTSGWENNPSYKLVSLKKVRPLEKPEWGLVKTKPLYLAFKESPERFAFLTQPQDFDFSDVWEVI